MAWSRNKIALVVLVIMVGILAAYGSIVWVVSNYITGQREFAAAANEDRQVLLRIVENLQESLIADRLLDECADLYYDDILSASGESQIALSELFSAVVERPTPQTDADRLEAVDDNRRLVGELSEANVPLRDAIEALFEYRRIDPPPAQCPHPRGN